MAGRNDPNGTNRDIRDDFRAEIREFLGTRRAKVTPEQAGLPLYGGERRRVTGLRREEVALLAGISSEYYTRLERGNATGVSESVIEGIAQALQLDEAERIHLLDLLRGAGTTRPPRRRPAQQRVRPTVQRVLDSMTGTPAFILSGRGDILAANHLGRALFPSTPTRYGRRTTPVLSFSARTRPSSSATGTKSQATRSPCCAPRPAATSTTGG
ncbi:transcriptional regulator with XRE-family HTH domain [Streptomyces sp. 3330]|nr:transcriptional regulator with XRE-family HTH domain [Streptomyces sp. 3330]